MEIAAGRHFYDAATPSNIPSRSLVAVFVNTDGSFAWPRSEVHRMLGIFGVSESTDPAFARFARCFAVEPGADSPQRAPAFIEARHRFGHRDAMGYVNLSNWEATERACLDAGHDPDWWVAHPGDRNPAALLSPVKGKRPHCVQIAFGSGFDLSVILRPLGFTQPDRFHATGGA